MSQVDLAKFFDSFNELCRKSSTNKINAKSVVVVSNGLVQNNKLKKSKYLKAQRDNGVLVSYHPRDAQYIMRCARDNDLKGLEKYSTYFSKDGGHKYLAALTLYENGCEEESNTIMDSLYEDFLKERVKSSFIDEVSRVVSSNNQSAIASKPRNPHYHAAILIAKATWEKYPRASKKRLCEKLRDHFNKGVSIDRLNQWIKDEKIQPPKPTKYTDFYLVIPLSLPD